MIELQYFEGWSPRGGPMTLKFEFGQVFFVNLQYHRPMFNPSDKQTSGCCWKHLSHFAM